ncbi:MFS transporter [Schlesneria paludicola]|uniref:MFS transporter n=1 Tax=Schlesneria paludicola TaxID=360056 RepID=UPI00029A6E48|nr:MFS transporter [Schlesneria paludicola]
MTASTNSPPLEGPLRTENRLTNSGRILMLITAFLGWMCAGFLLSITSVALQPAAIDLLARTGQLDQARYFELSTRSKQKPGSPSASSVPLTETDTLELQRGNILVGEWVAWLKCAFLFGAALGGLCFGAIGDRFGRTKGMGLAILTYSIMAGAGYFSARPVDLLVCWFLACMGVGGMWPNGVALVAEAWSSLSRTASAGIIGSAANIGIYAMSSLMIYYPPVPSGAGASVSKMFLSLTNFQGGLSFTKVAPVPTDWHWVMIFAAVPAVLGLFSLIAVPESPLWLARRAAVDSTAKGAAGKNAVGTREIFRPPYLWITIIGISLATIPIIGGWGSSDWMVQWADRVGDTNPSLKADVNRARAFTGIVGCLLGGWIASLVGRRLTYFLTSLGALCLAQYIFRFVVPTDASFLWWVSALGLVNGIYFGWLPFCLPELFPTRARSAGAGVSFNFGRILTAVTVFATGALMSYFKGDYAEIGRVTSLVYAIGLVVIWFAPDTSKNRLED